MKKRLDRETSRVLKENMEVIGGLSTPSKMPWFGWSTSAFKCVVGSELRKIAGSICSKCYACKGRYTFDRAQGALERRIQCIEKPEFVDAFVTVLKILHERDGEDRFRWHDSGDIQGMTHLAKLVEIAERVPEVYFYLPTKEAKLISVWMRRHPEGFPPNLVIKISHPMIGETFEKGTVVGVDFTTAGRDDDPNLFQCPAISHQGNKCLDCRACWTKGFNINYPEH